MGNMMFALACIRVLISPSVYTFFFLLTSELWKSLSTVFIIDSAYLTAVPLGKQTRISRKCCNLFAFHRIWQASSLHSPWCLPARLLALPADSSQTRLIPAAPFQMFSTYRDGSVKNIGETWSRLCRPNSSLYLFLGMNGELLSKIGWDYV